MSEEARRPGLAERGRSGLRGLLGAAVLAGIAVVWALLGPEERSLGAAIRPVYLHVGATWAGVTALYLAGIAGALSVALPGARWSPWLRSAWIAGLVAFALGFLLSVVAARISWGGVFWAEPRVRASLGVVALGMVALAVDGGLARGRLRGLVWSAAAVVAFVMLRSADLYVHPEQPIRPTTPWSIRGTFIGVYALLLGATALTAASLRAWGGKEPEG